MSHIDLWLARHGEVTTHWRDRLYGDLDVPLSPRGRAQSAALARRFAGTELAAVISSGLERAEYAAALLRAGRGITREDDAELREIGRGSWAGCTHAEIAARDPELWREHVERAGAYRAPGGESPDEVAARVLPALDRLARTDASGTGAIVVVAHRWVVAVAVCHALGIPFERAGRLELPHAALVHLRWPRHRGGGSDSPELAAYAASGPGPVAENAG